MLGVTVTDRSDRGVLAFDLIDIVRLLGSAAEDSEWEISDVEARDGAAAEELHDLADRRARVSGQVLVRLASTIAQVIDGTFRGYRTGALEPWIVVQAVDSSAFDIRTDDSAALARIRQHFKNVTELSSDVE